MSHRASLCVLGASGLQNLTYGVCTQRFICCAVLINNGTNNTTATSTATTIYCYCYYYYHYNHTYTRTTITTSSLCTENYYQHNFWSPAHNKSSHLAALKASCRAASGPVQWSLESPTRRTKSCTLRLNSVTIL